jgi:hypothetical protein
LRLKLLAPSLSALRRPITWAWLELSKYKCVYDEPEQWGKNGL